MRVVYIHWEHRLGEGGEGAVFLGRFETGSWCAIKAPRVEMWEILAREPLVRAFVRGQMELEIGRLARIGGRHHVRFLGANLDAPIPFFILELAREGSLWDEMSGLFNNGKVYHPLDAITRVCEILRALREAHAANVLHRDVKPENLLFVGTVLKLSDFGIARTLVRSPNRFTRTLVGTARYAAPEQLAGLPLDARADIFAVGVILYEMLMGTVPPLPARRFIQPSSVHGNITPALEHFLVRLLSPNPTRRPPSAFAALIEAEAIRVDYIARARRVA